MALCYYSCMINAHVFVGVALVHIFTGLSLVNRRVTVVAVDGSKGRRSLDVWPHNDYALSSLSVINM